MKILKENNEERLPKNVILDLKDKAFDLETENVAVRVVTGRDKQGLFIKGLRVIPMSVWLEVPEQADAYLDDLIEAINFLKQNYRFIDM